MTSSNPESVEAVLDLLTEGKYVADRSLATALFLALAPGGLAEMSIIALSFGTAAAFVSTHHIVRIILLVVIAPAIFRFLYMNKPANPKDR